MKYFYILKDEFVVDRRYAVNGNYVGENMFFISNERQLKSAIQQNKMNLYRALPAFTNL